MKSTCLCDFSHAQHQKPLATAALQVRARRHRRPAGAARVCGPVSPLLLSSSTQLPRHQSSIMLAVHSLSCNNSSSSSNISSVGVDNEDDARTLLWQALSTRLAPHLSDDEFSSRLWHRAAPAWTAAAAPPHGARAAAELAAGLDALCGVLSPRQAAALLLSQPAAVTAPLASWVEFLQAASFSKAQQQQILLTAPELLVNATILTAGSALAHLRSLGFEEDAARHRVIAWAPQVLGMQPEEITSLIALWSKFQVGVDQREW